MRRPRPSLAIALLVAGTCAVGLPAQSAVASSAAPQASAASAKKKKRTTAQRVTALSKSLNRAKSQQREAQKQLDAVVKQQAAIGGSLNDAISKLTGAAALTSPAGLLAALQDPSTGIPGYLDQIKQSAVDTIRSLLASQEYAVIAVTIGDSGQYVSPTLLISPDIPDIGAPVTVSGTVPIAIPGGLGDERVDVRVGAVSLEDEKGGAADPPFYADLNYFKVSADGYTGSVGEATFKGGGAGVNFARDPDNPSAPCAASAAGCGAAVWSGANSDFNGLPYWPVTEKLVSFDGTSFGARFDTSRMTALTVGGKMASLANPGATGPIRVGTAAGSGLAILRADISVTLIDPSVNPADPLA